MHYRLGCDGRALRDNKRSHKRATTTTTRLEKSKSTQNVHTPLRLLLVQCCVRWFHPFRIVRSRFFFFSFFLSRLLCSLASFVRLTAGCCCISHYSILLLLVEHTKYNTMHRMEKENRCKKICFSCRLADASSIYCYTIWPISNWFPCLTMQCAHFRCRRVRIFCFTKKLKSRGWPHIAISLVDSSFGATK